MSGLATWVLCFTASFATSFAVVALGGPVLLGVGLGLVAAVVVGFVIVAVLS